MVKGFFITFEGGEGAGKSTQIQLLAEHLKQSGHDVVVTREPGGTPAAEEIRNLLSHDTLGGEWSEEAELLLFFAARSMHIRDLISPALKAGKIVLSDRYIDSTRVYQGMLHNVDMSFIKTLEEKVVNQYIPDLTLLLDLSVDEVIKRIENRGAEDHYDRQKAENHQILRDGFLFLVKEEPDRIKIIDANKNIEEITTTIKKTVEEILTNAV